MASILLLKNAEVYTPGKKGVMDVLCIEGKIAKLGNVDEKTLTALDIAYQVIDASGKILTPGLIDPHQHFIGGSGEKGFATRTPEITVAEEVRGGITTMVGCIGVDTITRNMQGLLAHAKLFNEEGLTAYIWSGGYPVPPSTLTGSVTTDMVLVSEVLGAGEFAISDVRSSQPTPHEIAKIVTEGYIGGILTKKCGVTHFHMGDGKKHLEPLKEVLRDFDVKMTSFYPTHVNRNQELLKQAAEMTREKMTVDFDVCDEDLVPSLTKFMEYGGDTDYLTISTDASFLSPESMWAQMRAVMRELNWPLERVLKLATTNTSRILHLPHKGRIEIGCDADILLMNKNYELTEVIARGKIFMRDGIVDFEPQYSRYSNRKIEFYGKKDVSR